MDAKFSQLPNVLHSATVSAQVGLWVLQLSQQPDKEQGACLLFLQVCQSLLEILLETLPCSSLVGETGSNWHCTAALPEKPTRTILPFPGGWVEGGAAIR